MLVKMWSDVQNAYMVKFIMLISRSYNRMNNNAFYATVRHLLDQICSAKHTLKQMGVLRTEKFITDLGEWLVAELFCGTRANNPNQEDWDVIAPCGKIQVKTHAKSKDNNNRWSSVRTPLGGFDYLVIIVFSECYCIKEFYKVPIKEAQNVVKTSGPDSRIHWDVLSNWKLSRSSFHAKEDLLRFFFVTTRKSNCENNPSPV